MTTSISLSGLRPMRARDPEQPHRAASTLELFFDLVFVVAVSLAAVELAHKVEEGDSAHGALLFVMVFFAIWWAWVNFTWFASAYDTDDWLYRVVTIVQMGGALTVAAGVPAFFAPESSLTVVVVGCTVMRLAMVSQWLRAAHGDPPRRATALVYAGGVAGVQVLWIASLALPGAAALPVFVLLVLAELAVPVVAQRRSGTTHHREHLAERYGLFTIIVLGEGVLASANSVIEAIGEGSHVPALVGVAESALALVAGMWWLYFSVDSSEQLGALTAELRWGYGHYAVFASAAAVSAGVEVAVAAIGDPEEVGALAVRASVLVPVALFIAAVAVIVLRARLGRTGAATCAVAVAVLLASLALPLGPVATTTTAAVVVAGLVAALAAVRSERGASQTSAAPIA